MQNSSPRSFSQSLSVGPAELLGLNDARPIYPLSRALSGSAAPSPRLQLIKHLHSHSAAQSQTQLLEYLRLVFSLQSGLRLRKRSQQLRNALPLLFLLLRLLLPHHQTTCLRLHFRENQEGDGECSGLHRSGESLQLSGGKEQFSACGGARHPRLHSTRPAYHSRENPADPHKNRAQHLPVQAALLHGWRSAETHGSVGTLHPQPPPEVQHSSLSLQRGGQTPLFQRE